MFSLLICSLHHCFFRYFYFTTGFFGCFLSGTSFLRCCTVSATVLRELFLLSGLFYLTLLPDIWHNLLFYQGFPGAGSSALKVVTGSPTEIRNIDPAHLFESHSIQQKILVSRFYLSLLNYVPYVLSCPLCLVPYLLSRSRALRASCLRCSRTSRVSCPTCSRASRASCPTCSRASRASCSRALRASCLTCSRALRALVPHVPYVLSCLMCLGPYMPSCFMCLLPYVPRAKRSLVSHVS